MNVLSTHEQEGQHHKRDKANALRKRMPNPTWSSCSFGQLPSDFAHAISFWRAEADSRANMRRNIMPITRRRRRGWVRRERRSPRWVPVSRADVRAGRDKACVLHKFVASKTVAVAPDLVMRAAHRGTVSQDVQTDNCEL